MSDYYKKRHKAKRRTKGEKIGFYTALSVCMIAVCMAVYSTYNTLTDSGISVTEQTTTGVVQVNEAVTGINETVETPQIDFEIPTIAAETFEETQAVTESTGASGDITALQTLLSTDLSLSYPLKSNNVIREYNEKSVYYKTLNVWKPHKGVDFSGELGDDVFAMCGGTVTNISDDKLYGKTVEISYNEAVIIYSGLEDLKVNKGDSVEIGDVIACVGAVPIEASDSNHIHISVKIGNNYADPLSFINNNE